MARCATGEGKMLRVVKPDYIHHYPCFKKTQLAAVKHQLFHPNLPSLRHMDRDDVTHQLSDSHCRHTTCCTPKDFAEGSMSALKPPAIKLRCLDVTETGKQLNRLYFKAADIRKEAAIWARVVSNPAYSCDRQTEILLFKDITKKKDQHFDGVALRSSKPAIRNWRYTFKGEPRLDSRGFRQQQPTPSDVNSRYRHASPHYFRDMSNQRWRETDLKAEHPDPPCPSL